MSEGSGPVAAFSNITINGFDVKLPEGATVAAALLNTGALCRFSESGDPRSPLCGMGICFECRAVVNGVPHLRTCQIVCRDGMTVETQR